MQMTEQNGQLDGALVTGDAIHAQAATAELVLARGGDYLFALKADRPALLREVEAYFADPPEALATHTTTDADHGRIEIRQHRVTHSTDWIFGDRAEPGPPRKPGLATLASVTATRDDGPPSTRYYLSSAGLTAEGFARAVRSHWAIENALHWVRDVTFDEDRARNRADNGPQNLAIRRRLTLNLLRTARPKLPIARKRKRSGWSDAFARSIIGQMRSPCHRACPPCLPVGTRYDGSTPPSKRPAKVAPPCPLALSARPRPRSSPIPSPVDRKGPLPSSARPAPSR